MDPLIIPIVALAIPIIIVPVALALKHARLERQWEHAERMRALDLGRTLPQDESWWSPSRLGLALGVGVPASTFVCAMIATAMVGFHDVMWLAAGAVGVTGVLSGSRLAGRHLVSYGSVAKPVVDEDAYDVAGMRG